MAKRKSGLPADERIRALTNSGMSEREAIMTSMRRPKKTTKKSKKDAMSLCEPCDSSDAYPYGLEVRLENESLDKLKIEDLPKAGTKMTLTAEVEVSGSSQTERQGKEPRRNLTLQITKMSLE